MSRVWNRLNIIEVDPPPLADRLRRLAARLDKEDEPQPRLRHEAAAYLRQLADNEKALKALQAKKGRNRKTDYRADMALDCLVQRKLLGHGNFRRATEIVAERWTTSEANVESAFAQFRRWSEIRLDKLLDSFDDRQDKNQLLEDISADLRDMHGKNPD